MLQVRGDASYAERTVVTRAEPGVGPITISDTTEPQPVSLLGPRTRTTVISCMAVTPRPPPAGDDVGGP